MMETTTEEEERPSPTIAPIWSRRTQTAVNVGHVHEAAGSRTSPVVVVKDGAAPSRQNALYGEYKGAHHS